jgi:hypothetical protein
MWQLLKGAAGKYSSSATGYEDSSLLEEPDPSTLDLDPILVAGQAKVGVMKGGLKTSFTRQ